MWRWIIHPPMTQLKPFLSTMTQPTSPAFETIFSIPHYNLSAHTFAVHTLPLYWISSIINLLASDPVATCDLLVLDQINQTILSLKQQLDKQHCLTAWHFSTLLSHQSASQIPQHIHDIEQPDCRHCQIQWWQPTPCARQWSQPIIIIHCLSLTPCLLPLLLFGSNTGGCLPIPADPQPSQSPLSLLQLHLFHKWPHDLIRFLLKLGSRRMPWTIYLRQLQTVPEERRWGTAAFPIVVESPEAEETIFQHYYHWFINKGQDWGCMGYNRLSKGYCYDFFTFFTFYFYPQLLIHDCALLQQCMHL